MKCRNVEVRVTRSAEVVDEGDTEGSDGREGVGTAIEQTRGPQNRIMAGRRPKSRQEKRQGEAVDATGG